MKLYTCQAADGHCFLAVSFSDSFYDLAQFGVTIPDMQTLIDQFSTIRPLLVPHDGLKPLDTNTLRICAPIPYPRQDIICLGINYTAHAEEADRFDSDAFGGELRQNSNTAYLINSIASIISDLSQGMTLRAGTIIATGTPAGVGMGMEPPQFLNTGDTMVCEIEGIGTLTNVVQ